MIIVTSAEFMGGVNIVTMQRFGHLVDRCIAFTSCDCFDITYHIITEIRSLGWVFFAIR